MRAAILFMVLMGPCPCPCNGTQTDVTAHPNLTGVWKTNNKKSHYPHHGGPLSTGLSIQQQGNKLIERVLESRSIQQEAPLEMVYSLDGAETTTKVRGDEFRTTAKWEGQVLVITWKVSRGGIEAALKRELLLSSDGSTLTVKVFSRGDEKEPDQVLLLEKKSDTR